MQMHAVQMMHASINATNFKIDHSLWELQVSPNGITTASMQVKCQLEQQVSQSRHRMQLAIDQIPVQMPCGRPI